MDLTIPLPGKQFDKQASKVSEGARLFNQCKFKEAVAHFEGILQEAAKANEKVFNAYIKHWIAKCHYAVGNSTQAITAVHSTIEEDLSVEDDAEKYFLCKLKFMKAKAEHRLKLYTDCEETCDSIIAFEDFTVSAKQFNKYVMKAYCLKAKQMELVMEFSIAKDYLKSAKNTLKELVRAYNTSEEPLIEEIGTTEVLQDQSDLHPCKESMSYKKKFAVYLRKFAFYEKTEKLLHEILKEEVKLYGLEFEAEEENVESEKPKEEGEEEKEAPEDKKEDVMRKIKWDKSKFQVTETKLMSHPILKIARTYYYMGKTKCNTQQIKASLEYIDYAYQLTEAVLGTDKHLRLAMLKLGRKDALLKNASLREKHLTIKAS